MDSAMMVLLLLVKAGLDAFILLETKALLLPAVGLTLMAHQRTN
jgi:hypothetical protein